MESGISFVRVFMTSNSHVSGGARASPMEASKLVGLSQKQ
jgi:hypothetical protein